MLGPYPVGRTHVETKRIAFATVFSDSDVPAVARRFHVQADATVPSVNEMREAAATDLGRRGRGHLAECARVLGERARHRRAHHRRARRMWRSAGPRFKNRLRQTERSQDAAARTKTSKAPQRRG